MAELITFKDRNDLITKIEKIVMKKSDANVKGAFTELKNALNGYKRGDKKAMQSIIKLRKKMLNASSEVFIELEEEEKFKVAVAQLQILDQIEDED